MGVKKDNQWGFYDRSGKEVVPFILAKSLIAILKAYFLPIIIL